MKMKAVIQHETGGSETLEISEVDMPVPSSEEVLIKIEAAGINRPDIVQRNGFYPPPPGASEILGLECSGEIVEIGNNVKKWKIGDKVCALLSGGGYAEYATAHEGLCLPIPHSMNTQIAAAIPETFFTVWSNLFQKPLLDKGKSILIHGGTSGIGTTAIQLAKNVGATIFTTSGSDEKAAFCKSLGADHTINYKTEDFQDKIKTISPEGVDVILDMIAGDYMERNIKSLKPGGTLNIIAVQNGPKVNFNILPVMLKRLIITGSTLRPRSNEFKAIIADELHKHVWPEIEKGIIKPVINKSFPMENIKEAHDYLESGNHMGKIILET